MHVLFLQIIVKNGFAITATSVGHYFNPTPFMPLFHDYIVDPIGNQGKGLAVIRY